MITADFHPWGRLVVLSLFLAMATAIGCSRESDAGKEPAAEESIRPNLLIYLVDTLRSDHLGCYGYERDTTPEIDGIAREGLLFENAHVQSNWTQPSVGSIITSMPPLVFHSINNAFGESVTLPESMVTLAEILKEAGYSTAGFTANVAVAPELGFSQGFDLYKESSAELSNFERKKREGSAFDADTLNELAFAWLAGQDRKEPFFLYMHSVDPHIPYDPPEAFDIYDPGYQGVIDGSVEMKGRVLRKEVPMDDGGRNHVIALYDGEIRFNDHEIGRLMKELSRLDLLDRTLVVILSDHGEELFDRGKLSTGHGHQNLYEELTHVPLIMRLPGPIPSGKRIPELVSTIDVMPTLLDLLEVDPPEIMMGRSLLPLMEGRAGLTDLQQRETFCFRAKKMHDLFSIRTPDQLLLRPPGEDLELHSLSGTGKTQMKNLFPRLPRAVQNQWAERLKRKLKGIKEVNQVLRVEEEDFELSDEMRERFRALGYLK